MSQLITLLIMQIRLEKYKLLLGTVIEGDAGKYGIEKLRGPQQESEPGVVGILVWRLS